MLRKFISLGPRGCQIFGSNIRSCQLATQVPQNHEIIFEDDKNENEQKNIKRFKHVEHAKGELKYAEKLIDSWIVGAKVAPENRLKSILEFCNNKNDETYQNNIGEKIYMWCTGVLTVSSLLLCNNWIASKHSTIKNPKWLDPEIVQNVIKNYFWGIPCDHLLLSVKATPNNNSKPEESSHAANNFKETSDYCTASILNKLGLQMLAADQPKQAAELFRHAAENGHTIAIYNMGLCFDHGKGVPQNYAKAAHFYEIAAKRGHSKAQFNLATLYAEGAAGVKKDAVKALSMLQKAADNGITKAQVHMGFYYSRKGNHSAAAKYFKMASKSKDPVAMYHLGICLENGFGIRKDVQQAGYMYEEAAERGHLSAMFNIGVFYEKGLGGLTRSRNKAMYWFEKCAENGDEDAARKIKELHQEPLNISYKMHPVLRDIFMWNVLNRQERKKDFHKSKSTPNLQKNRKENENISFAQHEVSFSNSCGIQMQSNNSSSYSDLSLAMI